MSAFGPKRTSLAAPHMSAFGCKADMAFCGISLLRSLLGVKRTAIELAALAPDVILAAGGAVTGPLLQATRRCRFVFVIIPDPRIPFSAYIKAGLFVVAAAAALFAAAGTVAIPGFWAYLAIL